MLELFAGAGSVARVAQVLGYEVISVDISDEYSPDIQANILHFDPAIIEAEFGMRPSISETDGPFRPNSSPKYSFPEAGPPRRPRGPYGRK